jgi:hypothetical protein
MMQEFQAKRVAYMKVEESGLGILSSAEFSNARTRRLLCRKVVHKKVLDMRLRDNNIASVGNKGVEYSK